MSERASIAWATGITIETFFEVGANVGQTASEALAAFPKALVFAFEPHPDTFRRLGENVSDERLSIHQLALSDVSANALFTKRALAG